MRAVNRRSLALSLVLCACGSAEQPLPSIISVTPAYMAQNEQIVMTVDLEGTFPFKVDYASDSASLATSARLIIADQPFELLRNEQKGTRLLAEITPGLPVGPQELRVELSNGSRVVFAEGFKVTPPLDITNLSIDPITTQLSGQSFLVRVRVAGPDAELFRGYVKLKVSRGSITPSTCGPFSKGFCEKSILLDASSGADLTITAEDAAGHTVTSNGFQLR